MTPALHASAHLERFKGSPHWRGRTVADCAVTVAEHDPKRAVFFGDDPVYTAEQLVRDAHALAASLIELDVRPGEIVSFQLPNWPEAAVIDVACAMIGAVLTPIAQMLADSGSVVHFTAAAFRSFDYGAMVARLAPRLPALRRIVQVRGEGHATLAELIAAGRGRQPPLPKVRSDSVKLLLYTSGTTGRPKGVLHTHETLACFIESCARHWKIAPGEALLMPSPVTHIMETWNAATAATLIDRYGLIGTVSATPFLAELVDVAKQSGTGLPTLRFFGCGGAAVAPELIRNANDTFLQACAFRVFGCSEAPMVTLGWLGRENAERAAITDGEIVDYEVKIIDDAGRELSPGAAGEILVRGPAMFAGYADEAQTREAITPDGFFRTGDLGVVGADRSLTVTGRKKDLIIRGGENISPKEIEDVIYRHPAVAEVAVVSMPHPRLGEGVCAYVVPRADHALDGAAIVAHVTASGLARQKCPERVEIVSSLPKTASGKVRKDVLRAEIRDKFGGG
jgi:acyl-CoA synthetase (AMP-forming)/AMP-acid ligase II